MEILVSGLNSYLGRASVSYLQEEGFNVHGLVRDLGLLKTKVTMPITAHIDEVDLVKKGVGYEQYHVDKLDLGFYFTQIPDLNDNIAMQYELISLQNFISLTKKNNCNRIIYVGRTYDKKYLQQIKNLLISMQTDYTVVLKDVALGKETSFDNFMSQMLRHRYVFLFNPTGNIRFRPFQLEDIFKWIKSIPWKNTFIKEEIEFGGQQIVDLKDIFKDRIKMSKNNYKVLSISNKNIAHFLNKTINGIPYDMHTEYIANVTKGHFADNSKWQSLFPFEFKPI